MSDRSHRRDPVIDDGLHVIVPALMGVGMLISGALVVADFVRKLFPSRGVHRKQRIARGAHGVVASVARAAGYEVEGPAFDRRGFRSRVAYVMSSAVFAAIAVGVLALGINMVSNQASQLYKNGMVLGIAVTVGAVFGLLALQLLFFAVVHERSLAAAHLLVQTSWFGRPLAPPASAVDFAATLRMVGREGKL
ncbi:MAG: hypothetical protein V3U47_00800 [Acidimicrobiia bacterium]